MHRTVRSTLTAAALAAAAIAAVPHGVVTGSASLRAESRVWFEGTSTVRGYSCSGGRLSATVATDPAGTQATRERLVRSAELTVPVARLDCNNGTMNGHMRKALDGERHPNIRWRMTSYRIDGESVVITGALTIAGRTNTVELHGRGTVEEGIVRFHGSHDLRMTDYGVTPPTLMLGTMRVHDPVTVRFEIALDID